MKNIEEGIIRLKKERAQYIKQIKKMPQGHIECSKNGKSYKWRQCLEGKRLYIPKSNEELAVKLVYKGYLENRIRDIDDEIKALTAYRKEYDEDKSKLKEYISNPEISRLLAKIFTPKEEAFKIWQNEPYDKSTEYPERLVHRCLSKDMVRSKSEMMIDDALFRHGIPYRYECRLQLDGIVIYPDFTIKHPKTGEIIFWEHYGLIDNAEYARKHNVKMRTYIENGIYPTINLIATYETSAHPLDAVEIEKIIEKYFL